MLLKILNSSNLLGTIGIVSPHAYKKGKKSNEQK